MAESNSDHIHGLECIMKRAEEWGIPLRILVIGGQTVLSYCGRLRTTKDMDIVSPVKEQG